MPLYSHIILRQQLSQVHRPDTDALTTETARDVHKTARVARNNHVGSALCDAIDLLLEDAD